MTSNLGPYIESSNKFWVLNFPSQIYSDFIQLQALMIR